MGSEVRIVNLHIIIQPATGATESGKTRAKFLIVSDKSEAKRTNKYNVIAISTQQIELELLKTCKAKHSEIHSESGEIVCV